MQYFFSEYTKWSLCDQCFQDLNQNSILDTKTLFKIPRNLFGFSNNPRILFGPPSVNQCKFEVNEQRKEIKIHLKNF
ncbi:MAG: DUF2141 domain-containing protein [Saprospiraceae bacterium]|nr:DUF2141 domain-containing protein [Saprospiraceae bacterium]